MYVKKFIKRLADYLAKQRFSKSDLADHLRLGQYGEDLAVNLLKGKGYAIIARNEIINRREVDIIARDGDLLVFVEVKTRSGGSFGHPLEAIDNKRRERLKSAGKIYLHANRLKNVSLRFDAVSVIASENGAPLVEHFKNVF